MKDLMQYKGYYGSVHFDDKDFFFYGKLEFIRALVTYEATEARNLRLEFEKSVDEYLRMCKEEGIEPEQAFKGSFNVRIGKDLHKHVALVAAREEKSINTIIILALQKFINNESNINSSHKER